MFLLVWKQQLRQKYGYDLRDFKAPKIPTTVQDITTAERKALAKDPKDRTEQEVHILTVKRCFIIYRINKLIDFSVQLERAESMKFGLHELMEWIAGINLH